MGLKLIEQVMKVLELVMEGFIRQRVEMLRCSMASCLAVALLMQFLLCQLQEKHLAANKRLYMAFLDLESI